MISLINCLNLLRYLPALPVFMLLFAACVQKIEKKSIYTTALPEESSLAPVQKSVIVDTPTSIANAPGAAPSQEVTPIIAANATPEQMLKDNVQLLVDDGGNGGSSIGNGGDVLLCQNKLATNDKKATILDYYEAEYLYRLKILQPIDGINSANEYAGFILARLRHHDPQLYLELSKIHDEIKTHTTVVPNFKLNDIRDSAEPGLPNNCHLVQAAIQRRISKTATVEVIIADDIYSQLSLADQGGLILHEVLYRYFINTMQDVNSVKARYFTAHLSAVKFDDLSFKTYVQILKNVGIASYKKDKLELDISSLEFLNETTMIQARAVKRSQMLETHQYSLEVTPNTAVSYWSNGSIKSLVAEKLLLANDYLGLNSQLTHVQVDFYPNSQLQIHKIGTLTLPNQQPATITYKADFLINQKREKSAIEVATITFLAAEQHVDYLRPAVMLVAKDSEVVRFPWDFSNTYFKINGNSTLHFPTTINQFVATVMLEEAKEIPAISRSVVLSYRDGLLDINNQCAKDTSRASILLYLIDELRLTQHSENLLEVSIAHASKHPFKYLEIMLELSDEDNQKSRTSVRIDPILNVAEIPLAKGQRLQSAKIVYTPYGDILPQYFDLKDVDFKNDEVVIDFSGLHFETLQLSDFVLDLEKTALADAIALEVSEDIYGISPYNAFSLKGDALIFSSWTNAGVEPAQLGSLDALPRCVSLIRPKTKMGPQLLKAKVRYIGKDGKPFAEDLFEHL